MGVPQGKQGMQSSCPPMPGSFCIQHSGGRSLRLWLISACSWVSKCHFSRQNKVSPALPFTLPVCVEGLRVQGQGQGLGLNIPDHCSPIPASCCPPLLLSIPWSLLTQNPWRNSALPLKHETTQQSIPEVSDPGFGALSMPGQPRLLTLSGEGVREPQNESQNGLG